MNPRNLGKFDNHDPVASCWKQRAGQDDRASTAWPRPVARPGPAPVTDKEASTIRLGPTTCSAVRGVTSREPPTLPCRVVREVDRFRGQGPPSDTGFCGADAVHVDIELAIHDDRVGSRTDVAEYPVDGVRGLGLLVQIEESAGDAGVELRGAAAERDLAVIARRRAHRA